MKRPTVSLLPLAILLGACASPAPTPVDQLEFSRRLLGRLSATPTRDPMEVTGVESGGEIGPGATQFSTPLAPANKTATDAYRGLVELAATTLSQLGRISIEANALDAHLQRPLGVHEFAALAVLRAPEVSAAWKNLDAARTSYAQSADLHDLVAIYRSFSVDSNSRVGPERSKRATEQLAPSPNRDTLSAEIAHRTYELAFEALRGTIRDVVARAWTAHADAARLHAARSILLEEVEIDRVLVDVLRSQLAAGGGNQAGFLTFQARLDRNETELKILDRRETVVRADWNRLLSRDADAPVVVAVEPELPIDATIDPAADLPALALIEREELRSARLATERAELALRLAETMTLPRFDVGSSRLERESVGEGGLIRGEVFPAPGRGMMPRADFGVRDAQVDEMRARAEGAEASRDATEDRVRAETRHALFEMDAARERLAVHEQSIVPLARSSLDAARGAYEGNRATYLDLLDGVQRLLDARLGLADARRDLVYSQADLLRAVGVVVYRRSPP